MFTTTWCTYTCPTYKCMHHIIVCTTFILDKDGKIALSEYGAVNWNSDNIRKLLDGLIAE